MEMSLSSNSISLLNKILIYLKKKTRKSKFKNKKVIRRFDIIDFVRRNVA